MKHQDKQKAVIDQKLTKNITANEDFIRQYYPDEIFLTTTAQLQAVNRWTKKLILPENVRVAEARIKIKSNEQQRTLKKELYQAGILSRKGNSVFLTPEFSAYKVRVTDAVVNGVPYEFRNITGTVRKIEQRFGEAKKKGNSVNVFLNIEVNISIYEIRRRISLVLVRHPEYTGKIIISVKGEQLNFWDSINIR